MIVMSAVFFIICLYATYRACKTLSNNQKVFVITWYAFAACGLVLYTNFLIDIGWKYGIPGADMLNYFNAAIAMNKGASWSDLVLISPLYFAQIKFGTLMYFLFSSFVAVLLWIPIFNYQISLYLIYFSFLLLCIVSSINVAAILGNNSKKIESKYLYTTICCAGLVFAAYRLLRDTLLFYLITYTILYMKRHTERKFMTTSILLMFLCVVMRSYSLLIVLPYFLVRYFDSRKIRILVLSIPFFLISVSELFFVVLPYFNVIWELSGVELTEILNFLFFPNIFSQSQLLLIWNSVPHYSNYIAGSNLPGMYYLMSLWNFIVYPLVILGLFYKIKDRKWDKLFWLSILMNICVVYSILYSTESGLETRHKVMILIPLVYFAGEGSDFMRKLKIGTHRASLFYPLLMMIVAMGIFIIC